MTRSQTSKTLTYIHIYMMFCAPLLFGYLFGFLAKEKEYFIEIN